MITLKTLKDATDQEVFDQVANHMRTQNKKSESVRGNRTVCVYRSPSGLKCAAGCLIADDEYDPDMEGNSWHDLLRDKLVPSDHSRLIIRLQGIHDNQPVNEWREKLRWVAEDYHLTMENVR